MKCRTVLGTWQTLSKSWLLQLPFGGLQASTCGLWPGSVWNAPSLTPLNSKDAFPFPAPHQDKPSQIPGSPSEVPLFPSSRKPSLISPTIITLLFVTPVSFSQFIPYTWTDHCYVLSCSILWYFETVVWMSVLCLMGLWALREKITYIQCTLSSSPRIDLAHTAGAQETLRIDDVGGRRGRTVHILLNLI